MNFFDKLKAQVNPFDGGKSFGNPQGNQRQALPMRAMAQATTGKSFGNAMARAMQPRVGQAQVPFSQETADRYNADPTSFVGKNAIDPKYFGYPADDSGSLQVQPYGQQSIGRVQQNGGAQPFGQGYEDEYTAENALQQGGYNPQTTRHGGFLQDGRTPMSGIVNPEDEYLHRLQKLLGY